MNLKFCCFCIKLQIGCVAFGIFWSFENLIGFIFYVHQAADYSIQLNILGCLNLVNVIGSIFGTVGALLRKPLALLIWIFIFSSINLIAIVSFILAVSGVKSFDKLCGITSCASFKMILGVFLYLALMVYTMLIAVSYRRRLILKLSEQNLSVVT